MTRRSWLLGAAALLVVLLVGGRIAAVETAERTWAATFAGGAVLTEARTLARLLHGLVVLVSIAWTTGNVFVVYRAIGSVQMPRRLGDLEIVEAVPQRVLLAVALAAGIVGGIVLAWDTGDWWLPAVLALAPPHLGTADPILHHDLGYYLAVLPWHATLQSQAMAMVASAAAVTGLLYAGMGSLRIERRQLRASDHARAHLSALLACLALVMAWGAFLDSAEVVAGLHGGVDQAALDVRLPAAAAIEVIAVLTTLATLVWGWPGAGGGGARGGDRANLLLASWTVLILAAVAGYLVGPSVVRAAGTADSPRLAEQRAQLERLAFGMVPLEDRAPPGFTSPEAAAERMPLWDAERIAIVAGVPAHAVALSPGRVGTAPTWLVAPGGQLGGARIAVETDTGVALRAVPAALQAAEDSVAWFGPEFAEFATASPDSFPALRAPGIPLTGFWRRAALAWTLQAPELARAETDGTILVWRREVAGRLGRLAPFATFATPTPALADGGLWWMSWGYVTSETFPLARAVDWKSHPTRYARAGLVGAVRAATGETHVWLAPGYDSLTAAWARHFSPLIEPGETLPAALREQLAYPREVLTLAAQALVRAGEGSRGDSAVWTLRPKTPFEVGVAGQSWLGIGVEAGVTHRFEGLLAGGMTIDGPRLWFWHPPAAAGQPVRLPPELVGSAETSPGDLRIWSAGTTLFTAQAQFFQPTGAAARPRLAQVYVSIGERMGQGGGPAAALRDLVAGGRRLALADTSLAGRWAQARALIARADSALARGDVEQFGRLYRDLTRLLAPPPQPR